MTPSDPSDDDKRQTLRNAGWQFGKTIGLWYAPHCSCGQRFETAWQSYLLGKRCEQPLVKEAK